MTTTYAAVPALAPVEAALAVVRRRRGPTGSHGLAPGLLVTDPTGWYAAREVVDGHRLDALLRASAQRWRAAPPAAAALAWRSYTYWLAMPPVLGWATARRVPLLDPDDVLIRFPDPDPDPDPDSDSEPGPDPDAGSGPDPAHGSGNATTQGPLLTFGLRRLRLAVLPDDPLAGSPGVTVVPTEDRLLALLRQTMRPDHLDPLLEQIRARVRLGTRTLLGSLASAVAYAAVRGLDAPADEITTTAYRVLDALDVADLVDLPTGPDGHPTVQRHTCCLAFTLPEPKVCSGCCLRR